MSAIPEGDDDPPVPGTIDDLDPKVPGTIDDLDPLVPGTIDDLETSRCVGAVAPRGELISRVANLLSQAKS
jgi:hypothetical protein